MGSCAADDDGIPADTNWGFSISAATLLPFPGHRSVGTCAQRSFNCGEINHINQAVFAR